MEPKPEAQIHKANVQSISQKSDKKDNIIWIDEADELFAEEPRVLHSTDTTPKSNSFSVPEDIASDSEYSVWEVDENGKNVRVVERARIHGYRASPSLDNEDISDDELGMLNWIHSTPDTNRHIAASILQDQTKWQAPKKSDNAVSHEDEPIDTTHAEDDSIQEDISSSISGSSRASSPEVAEIRYARVASEPPPKSAPLADWSEGSDVDDSDLEDDEIEEFPRFLDPNRAQIDEEATSDPAPELEFDRSSNIALAGSEGSALPGSLKTPRVADGSHLQDYPLQFDCQPSQRTPVPPFPYQNHPPPPGHNYYWPDVHRLQGTEYHPYYPRNGISRDLWPSYRTLASQDRKLPPLLPTSGDSPQQTTKETTYETSTRTLASNRPKATVLLTNPEAPKDEKVPEPRLPSIRTLINLEDDDAEARVAGVKRKAHEANLDNDIEYWANVQANMIEEARNKPKADPSTQVSNVTQQQPIDLTGEEPREPPRKRVRLAPISRRRENIQLNQEPTFASTAKTFVVGAIVGGIGVFTALATLPDSFF